MESSLEETNLSLPGFDESRGSSVSTSFREEYEELLKHALIAPHIPMPLQGNYAAQTEAVIVSPLKKQPGMYWIFGFSFRSVMVLEWGLGHSLPWGKCFFFPI